MAQIVELAPLLANSSAPRTTESELFDDLTELNRLTCAPGLNPIFKTSINKIALTFRLRVVGLLAPLREGHLQPLKEDCLEPEQLSALTLEDLSSLRESCGDERLQQARTEIRRLLSAVCAESRYALARRAYGSLDQSAEAREALARFLSHHGFREIQPPADGNLYYGLDEGMSTDLSGRATLPAPPGPDFYLSQLPKIARAGFSAVATLDNLPGLESVPCSFSPENLRGDLVLRFQHPPAEKLWLRQGGRQNRPQIFRPALRVPFDLVIKGDLRSRPEWPNFERRLHKTLQGSGLNCRIFHYGDARASA